MLRGGFTSETIRPIPKTQIGLIPFRPHPLTSAARMMASEISRIDLRSFMLFC